MTVTRDFVVGLLEAWNTRLGPVERHYTPGCEEVNVAAREPRRGSATIRKLVKSYLRAFPDVQILMDEPVINGAQAELVWTLRGTHRGRFMNIPPTGQRVNVRGMTVMTLCEGWIHRVVRIRDAAGLLRGIKQLPDH